MARSPHSSHLHPAKKTVEKESPETAPETKSSYEPPTLPVLRRIPCLHRGKAVEKAGCAGCWARELHVCEEGFGGVTHRGTCQSCVFYEPDEPQQEI